MSKKTISIGSSRAMPFALVAMLAFSVALTGLGAANPSSTVAYEGDTAAPNPYFDVDTLTVAEHPMDKGADHSAMAGYYDDSGNWVSNPQFEVNTTADEETGDNVNPYSFTPTHVKADFYSKFPRTGTTNGSQDASALDASDWTTDASGSTGSIDVSDSQVATDVEALRISTSNQSSGDAASASFSNWTSELDSDEEKRVAQLGIDVDAIDSGAAVDINFTDETGDTKTVSIDPSADVDNSSSVMANATGEHVYQIKMSELATNGGGEYNNIESVDVEVRDGNADISVAWLDLEKKGKTVIAEKKVADSDGDYTDTETIYNSTGQASTHSMTTLDSEYDTATIVDVQMPVTFEAANLQGEEGEENDYVINWDEENDYPSYQHTLNTSYRMSLPSQIDLSYSGLDLKFEQGFVGDRFKTVGFEQGASSSTNLSDATLTDRSGSLGSPGDGVVLDSGVATGSDYIVTFEVMVTDDERSAIEDVPGAAAPPGGASDGGFVGFITSLPGMALSAATGFLSLKWLKGRGN